MSVYFSHTLCKIEDVAPLMKKIIFLLVCVCLTNSRPAAADEIMGKGWKLKSGKPVDQDVQVMTNTWSLEENIYTADPPNKKKPDVHVLWLTQLSYVPKIPMMTRKDKQAIMTITCRSDADMMVDLVLPDEKIASKKLDYKVGLFGQKRQVEGEVLSKLLSDEPAELMITLERGSATPESAKALQMLINMTDGSKLIYFYTLVQRTTFYLDGFREKFQELLRKCNFPRDYLVEKKLNK